MVVTMWCEAPNAAGGQCREPAVRVRRVGRSGYLFCAGHDWLWRQRHLPVADLTPKQVTALYHRIHPRSRRDGREAA